MPGRFVSPAIARIIPFAAFMIFIVAQSMAGDWLLSMGLDTRWFYPARAITIAILLLVFWSYYTELHGFAGITGSQIAAAFVAGFVVFVLWINLDFEWASFGKPSSSFDPTRPDGSGFDWMFVCFRVFGLAVVVPIMEELFWRSFLLRWLDQQDFVVHDPGKASVRAIFLSALLFATEHSLWFAGLLAGLVYGAIYVRSRNLWLPIVSHATTNAALAWWILATHQWQFW